MHVSVKIKFTNIYNNLIHLHIQSKKVAYGGKLNSKFNQIPITISHQSSPTLVLK